MFQVISLCNVLLTCVMFFRLSLCVASSPWSSSLLQQLSGTARFLCTAVSGTGHPIHVNTAYLLLLCVCSEVSHMITLLLYVGSKVMLLLLCLYCLCVYAVYRVL